jgi:hypothetical protein
MRVSACAEGASAVLALPHAALKESVNAKKIMDRRVIRRA